MQIRNRYLLLVIIIITLITLPIIYWSHGFTRVVSSLVVLLFIPGYTLLAAVFPSKNTMTGIVRIALSFGFSLAITPVIGLVLKISPLGLNLNTILIALVIVLLSMSVIALFRDSRLPPGQRQTICIPRFPTIWNKLGKSDRFLAMGLALVLVLFFGILFYAALTPNQGELYTEFYILDAQGSAAHYPKDVVYGDPVLLTIGIVNHENDTGYRAEVITDNVTILSSETGKLISGERWENQVSFQLPMTGNNQQIEFWLYKQGELTPYNNNPLSLIVNVVERN